MRKHLHNVALALLVLALLFDLVLWGAVPDLPDVGALILNSANNEAFLASFYIAVGSPLDSALPWLGSFGSDVMKDALADGFAAIRESPNLAMDLIFSGSYNATHSWVRALYWAPPVLLVVYLVLWIFRPKVVSLVGKRR